MVSFLRGCHAERLPDDAELASGIYPERTRQGFCVHDLPNL